MPGAAFYSYIVPEPAGFPQSRIQPEKAFYHSKLHEYILMYDDVRASGSPAEYLVEFLQSTYEAGASLAKWDRQALERPPLSQATDVRRAEAPMKRAVDVVASHG